MSDLQAVAGAVAERGDTRRNAPSQTKDKGQRDWTIKGLPSQTVDVAREAASASGMKINAWIGQIINESAEKINKHTVYDVASHTDGSEYNHSEIGKLRSQNEDLVRTVSRLSAMLAKTFQISE